MLIGILFHILRSFSVTTYKAQLNQRYAIYILGPIPELFLKTTSVHNIHRYENFGKHSFKNLLFTDDLTGSLWNVSHF